MSRADPVGLHEATRLPIHETGAATTRFCPDTTWVPPARLTTAQILCIKRPCQLPTQKTSVDISANPWAGKFLPAPAQRRGGPRRADPHHDQEHRGAVLMSFPCLGRCELAGVAATARRDGPSGQIGPMIWFTGLEDPQRFEALRKWIAGGGPRHLDHPARALPAALDQAVCGTSPPPQIRRG
jgi:hypothetical protein